MLNSKIIVRKAGIIVCLFLCIVSESRGQNHREIRDMALMTRFSESKEIFFDKGLYDWRSSYFIMWSETLRVGLSGDSETLKEHEEFFSTFRDHLDSLRASPEQHIFLMAEWNLQQALVKARYEKELESLLHFRQSVNLVKEGSAKYPDFRPLQKTAGLIHIMLGSVPDNYQWLLQLFGWRSSLNEGMEELKSASVDTDFGLEAKLFQYLTQAYLLDGADKVKDDILDIYTEHPFELIRFVSLSVLAKASEGQLVISISENHQENIPQASFIIGEAYLQKGEYGSAIERFTDFLEGNKGKELIKDAYLKIAICHKWMGNTELYEKSMNDAKNGGNTRLESDNNADRLITGNFNDDLLKCRLATDGGFYDLAEMHLNNFWRKNTVQDLADSQQLQAIYRQARIDHKRGLFDNAQSNYEKVLNNSDPSTKEYFVPNSALLLGKLLIDKNDLEQADLRLRQVLNYKGHEYKKSLDRKAKALLSTIQK